MTMLTDTARDFWWDVIADGGFTTIPRWTRDPRPGVAEYTAAIPDHHLAGAVRLAAGSGEGPGAVLLAAHAKVLAALSGESEIVTGYVARAGHHPVPCRLTTGPTTWRGLVEAACRVETRLRAHLGGSGDSTVDDVRAELGLSGPAFETVVDACGDGAEMAETTVLQVGLSGHGSRPELRLRYRSDVLDAEAVARIGGYHLTALAFLATEPDAEHHRQSLLSVEEVRFQLHELAGPHRELPDLRMHELFEERVRAHPEAVAAVHGDQQWTYRELNARANRLGRALLARGLSREAVVTVVMERNLDWLAAVLAIWKAGLTYLPLEPHFPAGRIVTAISRARSTLVLTETGSTATLDGALDSLSGVGKLFVEAACAENRPDHDLGVAVAADQLAYILFTSGSTGQPKGVMCEHAGMLNHMYAKIEDLGIGEGEVIPQTGPQCFDISVWQLVAALLVGGRTLIVDQETILDVERFVDTIVGGRAGVLQVVPSYLDVVVSYLEQHPRPLPDLHCVSPTGDFLKKELVQRWFAVQPTITLVNTYGLTETSDDAVHEIMDRVPAAERVPLGRPIINTHVDVVDEHGSPVPLGAPGLIVFSGVCVGRGYVNDPERTGAVFMADPNRAGQRICRTGDYGRWRADGKLDFLGRRDNQLKIRGFRIEIGEIENALLRVSGIRDGAVVVAEGADRSRHLVAFYSGTGPLGPGVLRAALTETLPEYMIPSAYHWQQSLPLTANGKIDRTVLTARASEIAPAEAAHAAPQTPTEQRLARAWAAILAVPPERIGRQDSFFELGGTSLSAVKLAVALDRAFSLKDLLRMPVLADLAAHIDSATPRPVAPPSGGSGTATETAQGASPPSRLSDRVTVL